MYLSNINYTIIFIYIKHSNSTKRFFSPIPFGSRNYTRSHPIESTNRSPRSFTRNNLQPRCNHLIPFELHETNSPALRSTITHSIPSLSTRLSEAGLNRSTEGRPFSPLLSSKRAVIFIERPCLSQEACVRKRNALDNALVSTGVVYQREKSEDREREKERENGERRPFFPPS